MLSIYLIHDASVLGTGENVFAFCVECEYLALWSEDLSVAAVACQDERPAGPRVHRQGLDLLAGLVNVPLDELHKKIHTCRS